MIPVLIATLTDIDLHRMLRVDRNHYRDLHGLISKGNISPFYNEKVRSLSLPISHIFTDTESPLVTNHGGLCKASECGYEGFLFGGGGYTPESNIAPAPTTKEFPVPLVPWFWLPLSSGNVYASCVTPQSFQ